MQLRAALQPAGLEQPRPQPPAGYVHLGQPIVMHETQRAVLFSFPHGRRLWVSKSVILHGPGMGGLVVKSWFVRQALGKNKEAAAA
jgi:hypothetical protein